MNLGHKGMFDLFPRVVGIMRRHGYEVRLHELAWEALQAAFVMTDQDLLDMYDEYLARPEPCSAKICREVILWRMGRQHAE